MTRNSHYGMSVWDGYLTSFRDDEAIGIEISTASLHNEFVNVINNDSSVSLEVWSEKGTQFITSIIFEKGEQIENLIKALQDKNK